MLRVLIVIGSLNCLRQICVISFSCSVSALVLRHSTDSQLKTAPNVFFPLTDQSLSSKQPKTDEEETSREDREYEEWKQRIIESATKALSAEKKTEEKRNS